MATATAPRFVPLRAQRRVDRIAPGLLVLVLAVVLASCDTVDPGGELITLQPASVDDLTFRFAADDVSTGTLTSLDAVCVIGGEEVSPCPVDLGDFLDAQGFSKADVVTARVEEAELSIGFPLGVQADFLSEVRVQFQAGAASTEVASSTSLASSRRVNLNVQSDNVASFITRPQFNVVLQIEPEELQPTNYELIVDLSIRIEVESI